MSLISQINKYIRSCRDEREITGKQKDKQVIDILDGRDVPLNKAKGIIRYTGPKKKEKEMCKG